MTTGSTTTATAPAPTHDDDGVARQNKLPEDLENPIDVFLLRLTARALPTMHAIGHTPNIITSWSFLCGLLAVLCLWKDQLAGFVALYSVSYVFDCMDGQFARRYHMQSRFGDYYDHITDVVVGVLIGLVVFARWRHALFLGDLVVVLTVLMLMCAQFGCQQRHQDQKRACNAADADGACVPPSETLDGLRWMCPCAGAVRWTRWFGSGTFQLFLMLYVVWIARRGGGGASRQAPPSRG